MPLSLLMKKLGRSLATAHPPPEPYAKKSRQSCDDTGEDEKAARSVAARTNTSRTNTTTSSHCRHPAYRPFDHGAITDILAHGQAF
ncbi:hypothetical protein FOYG_04570 [Fusarium oxysporum NRRL 32931]|uniref:Uncharacterized protein n=1 Tax=Fusarium oxysporum NRRL 32931 TaxID=660029 RepID=W9ISQ4_FUSOX|nr:hypothetical protein FOYG_04570 [Fusarium oxysporum NRRL 32931]